MTSIAIIGGTGYTGSNIAAEAAKRGMDVTAIARKPPAEPVPGVTYEQGAIDNAELVHRLAAGHDVLVIAIHAVDADDQPVLLPAMPAIADAAVAGGARLGVVGGAGSSLVAPDGPRVVDDPTFPAAFKAESLGHAEVLEWLRTKAPAILDWFYVSPAALYGGYNPGEATGHYRTGDDVLVSDAKGVSNISGADFALAFVDEIEHPTHHNTRFTTGY